MPIAAPQRPATIAASAITITIAFLATGCDNNETPPNSTTQSNPTQPQQSQTPTNHQQPPQAPQPTTTEDGLTLTDLSTGTGEPVPPGAAVTIEFKAWIVGQSEPFDSTDQRRRPLSFNLDNHALIQGLRLGIQGMRQGGTRRIEIPADLAYGPSGRHPIPPDADLIYEVTLINWQPANN